jgi:hypothetical protein
MEKEKILKDARTRQETHRTFWVNVYREGLAFHDNETSAVNAAKLCTSVATGPVPNGVARRVVIDLTRTDAEIEAQSQGKVGLQVRVSGRKRHGHVFSCEDVDGCADY